MARNRGLIRKNKAVLRSWAGRPINVKTGAVQIRQVSFMPLQKAPDRLYPIQAWAIKSPQMVLAS